MRSQDFPDGSVVKTLPSNARGMGLIPGQGAMIPRIVEQNPKRKTEAIL